ncbi:acetoin reductase [Rhodococcus opacus]|uniref:acetoin reductase n=1 Tax=Rhodococcus opacus TaxID=37919 RepID=UPI001C4934D7|nr:acetoin reductase [Rhodococcus opacus]MBV6759855.1 acetoin reductase [Rhodococcus opacus]
MSGVLTGKVAIITGAGQGIGEAIALRLAQDGASIGIIDLDTSKAETVADKIRALGVGAQTATCDVSDRDQLHAAVAELETALGGFDIMINNAGIAQVLPLLEVRPEDLERITRINIGGVLWGIQAAAASFIDRGIRGKIINACSIAAFLGQPVFGVYSSTKFAVRALTQAAAQEYAQYGITVNGYSPGTVGTDMWDEIDRILADRNGVAVGESFRNQAHAAALGRPSTPDDVAGLVAFLAGPDSNYMTGQSPLVDGGMLFN